MTAEVVGNDFGDDDTKKINVSPREVPPNRVSTWEDAHVHGDPKSYLVTGKQGRSSFFLAEVSMKGKTDLGLLAFIVTSNFSSTKVLLIKVRGFEPKNFKNMLGRYKDSFENNQSDIERALLVNAGRMFNAETYQLPIIDPDRFKGKGGLGLSITHLEGINNTLKTVQIGCVSTLVFNGDNSGKIDEMVRIMEADLNLVVTPKPREMLDSEWHILSLIDNTH